MNNGDVCGSLGLMDDLVCVDKVGNEPSKAREHHERAERAEQMSEQTLLPASERAW